MIKCDCGNTWDCPQVYGNAAATHTSWVDKNLVIVGWQCKECKKYILVRYKPVLIDYMVEK